MTESSVAGPCPLQNYSGEGLCYVGGRETLGTKSSTVLNWANVCSPEHTSDTSTNYDSFLN